MDLFPNYPIAFLVTVVFPVVSGIAFSVGAYDSLRARADADAQLTRIENNAEAMLAQLPDLNTTLATLVRYERALASLGQRDEVLVAVLIQYQGMKRASETWDKLRTSTGRDEKAMLASEVLDVLSKNLIKVDAPENLPSKPLILGLGANVFRVLFAAPMRLKPQLDFQNLPAGSRSEVTDKSEFGFTVRFTPPEIVVTEFGLTANSEL